MKRLGMFVAVLGLPILASAQVAPPPPPPPPTPAVPPVPAPAPPAPRAVVAPTIDVFAIEDAVRMAREAQYVDRDALREITQAARAAAEASRVSVQDYAHLMGEHAFDFNFDFQERPFAMTMQSGDSSYSSGLNALTANQYERAIVSFDRVIAQKGSRADAATYHKAFAQFRMGRSDDALATLTQLRRDYPQSRYLNDAKVLEADVRKSSGQPLDPTTAGLSDDIKLLAIQSLQHTDPERAVPLLEGVLTAANSLKVKKQAIYLLALSTQPRAREILLTFAKGGGNPDLQLEAIKYIAANRNRQTTSADLQQIYQSTEDTTVRLAIIRAYQSAGDRTSLVSIAGSAAPVAVRSSAISGLSNLAAPQDLYALYQKESNKDLKLQIVATLGSMRALDQLNQILRAEKDPEVRRRAVRAMGSLKADQTGTMLSEMYGSEQDVETRKAVIAALSAQNNAEALVAIARKETSLELKRDIVRRLSDMAPRSKVAADFMMELINR